ncbi:hypothetical protein C8Q80DRAFT_1124722 [Daedaleopsis nitida]|nr:hypothetical protein C8Q80DRAFT_1124722 [Daedaleopsis nitida]
MSSLSDPNEIAEITALYNDVVPMLKLSSRWIDNYCNLAAVAFFIYEFIILFGSEVEYFWRRKITGASILFLLSRYLFLIYSLVNLAIFLPVFTDNLLINTAFCRAFSALRAFALSQSRVWMAIVFVLSLAPVGVNGHPRPARYWLILVAKSIPFWVARGLLALFLL